jgi:hypothetical protein
MIEEKLAVAAPTAGYGTFSMYIAKLVVTLSILFFALSAGAGQQALLNRLQADYDALLAAQRDYQWLQERGVLGAAEAADYADYLTRLGERVSEDCLMLARVDIQLLDGLPCPSNRSSVVKPAPIDQRSEQTGAERTATMDAELNAGLGEFDEMLLREQERVKAATSTSHTGGASGDADSGRGAGQGDAAASAEGGRTGDAGESGDATASGEQSVGGEQRVGSGVGGQPPSGAAGGGGTRSGGRPADIPDGSDDDLVARQMREAAEKETDPELKKKLWEEYRKYKQGSR